MEIRYQPFKEVTESMPVSEMLECETYNRGILSLGVKGVTCRDAGREPTRGERIDYEGFAPEGSMISSVEEYVNGAKNIFVRTKLEWKQIGVITVRYPLDKFLKV